MGRAFAEHWKGVIAGLVMFNVGFAILWVAFPVGYVAGSDRPAHETVAQVPAAISAGTLMPVGMENQATAVVENPYGLGGESFGWLSRIGFAVVMLLASGATAARIGARVVAWRGALVGVLGMVEIWAFEGFPPISEAALTGGVLASMTYTGGGLMKLLTWARSRPA